MAGQTLLDVDVINKALASVTYDPDLLDFIVALQGASTTMSSIHSSMTAYRDAYLALYQSVPKYTGDTVSGEEDITIPERVNLEREPLAATLNGMRSYISVLIKLYRAKGTFKVPASRTILIDVVDKVEVVPTSTSQTSILPKALTISSLNPSFSKVAYANVPGEKLTMTGSSLAGSTASWTHRPSVNVKGHTFKPSATFTESWDDESGTLTLSSELNQPNLQWDITDSGSDNIGSGVRQSINNRLLNKDNEELLNVTSEINDIRPVAQSPSSGSGSIAYSVRVTQRSSVPITVSVEADVSRYALFQQLLRPVASCVADYIEFVQTAVGSNAYSADDIALLRGN